MLFQQLGSSTLVVHTPAKLNLFLEILAKRADGYHEVETLLASIGLYDTLFFTEDVSNKIGLQCFDVGRRCERRISSGEGCLPEGPENLVVRAAELLRDYAGVERGVQIELQKRIPLAAGLAGGSSDAAATLAALNRLWDLKLSVSELQQLASQLGSDVAFFLAGATAAVCRGRGEKIEPLALPLGLHFVVVRPTAGLSTAEVYRHCQPPHSPRTVGKLVDSLKQGRLGDAAQALHNALQVPAEQLSTDVRQLRTWFSRQPVLGHMMSGSGTAYFGLCGNRRHAVSIAARLRAERFGRVYVVQCRP